MQTCHRPVASRPVAGLSLYRNHGNMGFILNANTRTSVSVVMSLQQACGRAQFCTDRPQIGLLQAGQPDLFQACGRP